MAKVLYANVIKSLIYVMMCTRPDISYIVGLVSIYKYNPSQKYWSAVKRILAYLKGTVNYCLCYQGDGLQLVEYLDPDWDSDLDERKLTSGYVFLLNRGTIT